MQVNKVMTRKKPQLNIDTQLFSSNCDVLILLSDMSAAFFQYVERPECKTVVGELKAA